MMRSSASKSKAADGERVRKLKEAVSGIIKSTVVLEVKAMKVMKVLRVCKKSGVSRKCWRTEEIALWKKVSLLEIKVPQLEAPTIRNDPMHR